MKTIDSLRTACCLALAGIVISGCSTSRHYQDQSDGRSLVMRTDVIQAAALLHNPAGQLIGVAFLGQRATYRVTGGAAALIKIIQSPVAAKIWVYQYPWGDKLTLDGVHFHGSIEMTAGIAPDDKTSISLVEELGFKRTLPEYFTRTLHVQGDVGAPVKLPQMKWPHPITIDIWGPEKVDSPPDALKKLALTPVVALGVPVLVGVWVVTCFAESGSCSP